MILKIGTNNGWVMYGGIERIKWGHSRDKWIIRNADGVIQCRNSGAEGGYEDVDYTATYLSRHQGGSKGISWASFRQGTIDQRVVFDGSGYLCNDTGKTIEVIT